MGGFPDEMMKKALEEAIKNMAKPPVDSDTANFMQVVPNSHRFTLYGLKIEIDKLKTIMDSDIPDKEKLIKEKLEYLSVGINNSQREDIEMI